MKIFLENLPLDDIVKEFPDLVRERRIDSNKGSFGSAIIVGGGDNMIGAGILAATASLKVGSGKTFLCLKNNTLAVIESIPELIIATTEDLFTKNFDSIGIGPGFGVDFNSYKILKKILYSFDKNIVLDADALNIIARFNNLFPFQNNINSIIITPHPGEASRLLNTSISHIQKNREESCISLAEKFNAIVVLKGHKTIIADYNGKLWENNTGNNLLSVSGTGDILTGIITSLLAQRFSLIEATRAGVWLHGLAADYLLYKGFGPIGILASELIDIVRAIRNHVYNFYQKEIKNV